MSGVAWRILAVLGPLAVIALFAFGLTRDPGQIPSVTVGRPAPAFELDSLDGNGRIRLADYGGRAVIINFWASWCVSCRVEHDVLIALGNRFADRDDVALLGVNHRDTNAAAKRFLDRHGAYPYPSAADPDGRTGIDFGVYGLPETYFVDSQGRIRHRHIGPIDMATALALLEEIGVPE